MQEALLIYCRKCAVRELRKAYVRSSGVEARAASY